jgi:hypothetical protein
MPKVLKAREILALLEDEPYRQIASGGMIARLALWRPCRATAQNWSVPTGFIAAVHLQCPTEEHSACCENHHRTS